MISFYCYFYSCRLLFAVTGIGTLLLCVQVIFYLSFLTVVTVVIVVVVIYQLPITIATTNKYNYNNNNCHLDDNFT